MKTVFTFLLLQSLILSPIIGQTEQELKEYAATFPEMPRDAFGTAVLNEGGGVTFGSGTPYNDLEYTIFDSDYMEGETNGYDLFFPADPSDEYPGSNRVRYVRTVNNLDLDSNYDGQKGDRIILGTADFAYPFCMAGDDSIDNDYVSIQNFDYLNGHIQLQGAAEDYDLIWCDGTDGCATRGHYLFYTKDSSLDLIAFIFPCDDLGVTISGNGPQDTTLLCNDTERLSLTNSNHFRYAVPVEQTPTIPDGVVQFGTRGKEIVGGVTSDRDGNTYTYGASDGSLDGNPRQGHEIFVVKHSSTGEQEWVYELTQPNAALLFDGITDEDHLYVVGRTLGALPGFTSGGRWDAILLKIDLETGALVASDQFGNGGLDGYGNITIDDDGNLLLSGQGGPEGVTGTDPDYMIAKYEAASLENIWRAFTAPADNPVFVSEAWGGISYVPSSTPGDGRLVVAGWYMTLGGANAFVTIYENLNEVSPQPSQNTVIESNGVQADWILDNVVDTDGNIYVGGYTTGNLQGQHQGDGDAFVAKFSADLSDPQFLQFGTPYSDNIRKMEIDDENNIYVSGYTYGNLDGLNSNSDNQSGDVYVAKIDADLQIVEVVQFGTEVEDRGYIHLRDSTIYLAGMTEGSLVSETLGSFDGFVIRLRSSDLSIATSTTSSVDVLNPSRLTVYPNPTESGISLKYDTGAKDIKSIEVYNSSGQLVWFYPTAATYVDLSWLPADVYSVAVLYSTGEAVVKKVFKH